MSLKTNFMKLFLAGIALSLGLQAVASRKSTSWKSAQADDCYGTLFVTMPNPEEFKACLKRASVPYFAERTSLVSILAGKKIALSNVVFKVDQAIQDYNETYNSEAFVHMIKGRRPNLLKCLLSHCPEALAILAKRGIITRDNPQEAAAALAAPQLPAKILRPKPGPGSIQGSNQPVSTASLMDSEHASIPQLLTIYDSSSKQGSEKPSLFSDMQTLHFPQRKETNCCDGCKLF